MHPSNKSAACHRLSIQLKFLVIDVQGRLRIRLHYALAAPFPNETGRPLVVGSRLISRFAAVQNHPHNIGRMPRVQVTLHFGGYDIIGWRDDIAQISDVGQVVTQGVK